MPTHSTPSLIDLAQPALKTWWKKLYPSLPASPAGWARADRAMLKRAGTLDALSLCPAYQRLYQDVVKSHADQPWPTWQMDRLAITAGVLVHVYDDAPKLTLPMAMSQRDEGADRNAVSELRFRRLLDSPDAESLFTGLRRLMPLMKHKADVESVISDLLFWGDKVKRQWAYDYRWPTK